MPVSVECNRCGQSYRVSDDKIGSRIRCKNCQAPILVQEDDDFDDDYGARQPARPSSGKKKSKRKSGPAIPPNLLIGGGVAVLLLIGVVVGVNQFSGNRAGNGAANPVDGTASIADSSLAPAQQVPANTPAISAEEQARRQAAYQAQLERQRQQQSQGSREDMSSRFGNDKVVTVTFANVAGDTAAADKYLQRKVFRAAYKEYSDGSKRAQQQTEANRKQAEQDAVANANGQMFVYYHYRQVRSDVPYPQVINGGRNADRMTYHVGPALDPNAFAQRLNVGEVSSVNGRNIEITVYLPVPIPDPDVEDLVVSYGQDQVLTVKIHGANGDARAIKMYIEEETRKAAPDNKFTFVAFKEQGNGNYEFTVGPIVDQTAFSQSLKWGNVDSLAGNVLTLTAAFPPDMPTYEQMVAAKQERERKERAIQDADRNKRPRPDESELDWAVRCLKDEIPFTEEKALNALAIMDVNPDRLQEVAKLIELAMLSANWQIELYIKAFVHWKTDRTEQVILSMGGGSQVNGSKRKAFMEALVVLKTEKCARALASALPDFFAGDECVPYLIEMGALAEKPTLGFLKHEDAKVRARVYRVLTEIGTKESLSPVRGNVRLENSPQMKSLAQECGDAILARVKEEEAKPADGK